MGKSKIALYGMLVALAFIFSYLESFIPFIAPGMKIGLANLVVVIALYTMESKNAFLISMVRVLLNGLTFQGFGMMLYSFAGGLLSFAIMLFFKKSKFFSVMGVSIAGGVAHNLGQLVIAAFVLHNINMAYYFPALLISGCIAGMGIGLIAHRILLKITPVSHLDERMGNRKSR